MLRNTLVLGAVLGIMIGTNPPAGADTLQEAPQLGPVEAETQHSGQLLTGRHRLELRIGYWGSGSQETQTSTGFASTNSSVEDVMGAISYAYWAGESVATNFTLRALALESSTTTDITGVHERHVVVSSMLFGLRYYPIRTDGIALRPYLAASLGPYLGVDSVKDVGLGVSDTTKTMGTVGSFLGGGLDFQMGRYFMAGVNLGYHLMADFPEPLLGEKNHSGFELGLGLSLLMG